MDILKIKQQNSYEKTEFVKEKKVKKENHIKQQYGFLLQKEETEQTSTMSQKSSSSVEYKATEDLIKLMEAKTISQVKSIIAKLQGEIGKIKASGASEEQIKETVSKIKKVIKKAEKKEKALIEEERMKIQINLTEEKEKAEEMSEELENKKNLRRMKEVSDIANLDDLLPNASEMACIDVKI